jgi:hypothetical protein
MMATVHGMEDEQVQQKMLQLNAGTWDPRVDRNILRAPERFIHVFTISARAFVIDRAPLWTKLHLRSCPAGERYAVCAHIPDPMMQMVHSVENGRQRGEAHDGLRVAIDLLDPNNPTTDPDWQPGPEMASMFGSSKGCNLFSQGLFLSLREIPFEHEIVKAEGRRSQRYLALIAHADSLEQVNRKELEDFIKGEDGTDLRLALDFFGEQRAYHKPMIATRACPNCGDYIKVGVAFHLLPGGIYCVNDWQKAVAAGVKTKSDVPDGMRWWDEPVVLASRRTGPAGGRSQTSE